MYQFEEEYEPTTVSKSVKIFRNGNSQLSCNIVLTNQNKLNDIKRQLSQKWDTHFSKLRLFSSQGVEIMEDELDFVKSDSVLFASKGEDFDESSQLAEYEILQDIGEGGFGKVVLGKHRQTGEKVAIKMVKGSMITNAQDVEMIFREATNLKSLKHDNIVKIYNAFFLPNFQTVFIMEYLEGGELLNELTEKGTFSEAEARNYFKQLASAIAYCHQKRIIHRDLKLENLLLSAKGSGVIKAIDFGISGYSTNANPENADAGSLRYMAPELLTGQDKAVSPQVDVWSMGVILYGMLTGSLPFTGTTNKEIIAQIQSKFSIPPEFRNKLSMECQDCIFRTLEQDPKARLTSTELLRHPFISEDSQFKINLLNDDSTENSPQDQAQQKKKTNVQFAQPVQGKKGSQTPQVKKSISTNSPLNIQTSKTPTGSKQTSKFSKK